MLLFRSPWTAVLLVLCSATVPAAGQAPRESAAVARQEVLVAGGGRVDWAVQGDLIAYDRRSSDGYYDLYLTTPEGTLERCLTCPLLEFRKVHAFNPSWHPSGKLLVFQAQPAARKLEMGPTAFATPDRGLHSQLWTISRDGQVFLQLLEPLPGRAILDPHFSHEGDLLAWSERYASRRGKWGAWEVEVAPFSMRVEIPKLGKVRSLKAASTPSFVEIHGFSPNDRRLLVSANLEVGQREEGMDLYWLDLGDQPPERLTSTLGDWDEHGHLSPDGRYLAWTSNRNVSRATPQLPPNLMPTARPPRRDLWLRDMKDGSEIRLTYFNDPASPQAQNGATVTDLAWSPDSTRLAVSVLTNFAAQEETVYLLTLKPPASEPELPLSP